MSLDPLALKKSELEGFINKLYSSNKNDRLIAARSLGLTIGIGIDTGLEKKAIEILTSISQEDNDRGVRKAAEEALGEIKKRINKLTLEN